MSASFACRSPARALHVSRSPGRSRNARKHVCLASTELPPSSRTASSLLDSLQRFSVVLPAEIVAQPGTAPTASTAVVTFALLHEIVANANLVEYVNAIERAISFTKQMEKGSNEAAMDAALVNVGMMLADDVAGRVVVEVDPRLARDSGRMQAKAKALVAGFEARGLGKDKLLMQLPASWEGLQAVAALEREGVQCQVNRVYSFAQGVAAVRARASAVMVDIRRIDTWHDKYPGYIRDPMAPRQDAGLASKASVGIRIATAVYNYAQQQGGHTKVVAIGVKSASEAILLSGVDYMVLPEPVKAELASTGTLQGYNDGLAAAVSHDERDDIPAMTPELAQRIVFKPSEVAELSQDKFDAELGQPGAELLALSLQDAVASTDRVARFVESYAVAQV